MSKKMMLLALAVASMTMFALPAASSAAELHFDVPSFTGDTTAGTLVAEGEPTITCVTGSVAGTPSAGGTTGTIHLHFTECHTTVFGFTAKCKTNTEKGADNTITAHGTYHMITTGDGPAILVTVETVTIVCAGISNTVVHGNVIGTIEGLKCGETGKKMTINFASLAPEKPFTQAHELYTGTDYDLTATTGEGGAARTAALTTLAHVESTTEGTLNCT